LKFFVFFLETDDRQMALQKKCIENAQISYTVVNGSHASQNLPHSFVSINSDRDKNKPHYVYLKFVPSNRPQLQTNISVASGNPKPDYLTISNSLRSSICSGYPILRGSHSRIVHNAEISKEHFESVTLEQQRHSQSFRRKKDWLGRWTEANIVRDRLMKDMINAQKKTSAASAPA